MRRLPFFLLLLLVPIWLCGFVRTDTADVLSGQIIFVSSGNVSVTHLSGDVEFILSDTSDLAYTDSGFLFNYGSAKTGLLKLNNQEYNIRFNNNSELQIEQTYTVNNTQRTTWVDYHLRSDLLPSSFSFSDVALISVSIILFVSCAFLILQKGVI